MSDPNAPRGASVWWVLLVLPAALGIGWWAGHSEPAARPDPVIASEDLHPARRPVPARAADDRSTIRPAPPVEAKPVISDWTTYRNAVDESQKSGKPILLDFNADWCPPCQRLKREVFEDRTHFDVIGAVVIPVSVVDRRRETGSNTSEVEDLQNRFGVEAFPTLVVFSPANGRMSKKVGYGGPDGTKAWVAEAVRAMR